MIHAIFSVRDKVADAYLQPFFSVNTGSAIRAITQAVNDPEHTFAKNIEDYSLWGLGTFDDATGKIDPNPDPAKIANLMDFLKKD